MPKQNKLISSSISIWVPLQVSKQLSVQLTKPVLEVKPRLSLAQAWEGRRGQHCPSIRCRVRDQKQRKHSPGTAGRSKNTPKALRCKKKLGTGPGGSVEHPHLRSIPNNSQAPVRAKSHHKASCGHGQRWCAPAPPGWTQQRQSPRQTAVATGSAGRGGARHEETRRDCAHPWGYEGIWGWGVRRGILPHLFDDCRKSSLADCCVPRALAVALWRSPVGRAAAGKKSDVWNVRPC